MYPYSSLTCHSVSMTLEGNLKLGKGIRNAGLYGKQVNGLKITRPGSNIASALSARRSDLRAARLTRQNRER
jgi:hypothetical protein